MKTFLLLISFFIFTNQIIAQDFPIGVPVSQDDIPLRHLDSIKYGLKADYIINAVKKLNISNVQN